MNKTELIDALAARYEGNRKAAAHALESVLDTITREVSKGEKVAITGFGSFEKRVREARWVRNPQTGERIKAKKKSVPKFTPGADLKNVVSGAKKLPKLTLDAALAPGKAAVSVAAAAAATTKKATTKKASSTAGASTAKKAPAKKAPAKKAPAAKSAAKKTATASSTAKKSTTKKTAPAKSTAAKSTAAKSTVGKSTAAKKAPAKKSTTKKTAAKKS